jgi:DNA-binding ferritin-like protein
MANYTTVRELIDNLLKEEDLDSPVIYQYYLGEHFDVSDKVFAEVAKEFDSMIPSLSDAYDAIAQAVAEKDDSDGI